MSNTKTVLQKLKWPTVLAITALVAYGFFVSLHFTSGPGGSDSSGYLNSARLLMAGRLTTTMKVVPELGAEPWRYCFPLGFAPLGRSTTMAPTYPVGLPLLLVPTTLVAGWHWGPLVTIITGTLLTLVLCHLSARELGAGRPWAMISAAAFACSPLLLFSSVQVLSDGPTTTWCAAAFYAALRARRSLAWAAGCGAAVALAVMIRPSSVAILPALIVMLWHGKKLVAALVGGLPAAAGLAWYDTVLWGKPWATGYGNLFSIFETASVLPTVVYYAQWIPHLFPGAVVAMLGLLLIPWRTLPRGRTRELVGLILGLLCILTFYAFYPLTRGVWWSLRFVLPAFPILVVLCAVGLEQVSTRFASRGRIAAIVMAVLVFALSAKIGAHDWRVLGVGHMKTDGDRYLLIKDWVRDNVPDGAIISSMSASGTLAFDERVVVRWDQVSPQDWAAISEAVHASGRPLYAVAFPGLADEMLHVKTPGAWEKVADISTVTMWKLTFPK